MSWNISTVLIAEVSITCYFTHSKFFGSPHTWLWNQTVLNNVYCLPGPLKRVKKLYLSDQSAPVPRRTLRYWNANPRRTSRLLPRKTTENTVHVEEEDGRNCDSVTLDSPERSEVSQDDVPEPIVSSEQGACELSQSTSFQDCSSGSELSDYEGSINLEYDSESDSEFGNSNYSSTSDSVDSESFSDEELTTGEGSSNFTETQLQSLSLLAFILRHKLTGVAAGDLISLQKVICPDSSILGSTKYEELLERTDGVHFKVKHYCPCCQNVFPENPDVYQCEIPNCVGLRYEGGLSAQTKVTRRPRNFFVIADVSCQLKCLLEQDGMLESIYEMKAKEKLARDSNIQSISDITEGHYYRSLMKEGELLVNPNCISALFNTDGIPLYKSSRVKLWPIFLAINEIPLNDFQEKTWF